MMFDEHFPPYCAETVMRWTPTWSKQTDPSGRYVFCLTLGHKCDALTGVGPLQSMLQSTRTPKNEHHLGWSFEYFMPWDLEAVSCALLCVQS
jgi:hypothetical protein